MNEYILTNEAAIRAASFFGIFIVVALWELVGPRRKLSVSKGLGWINNLGLYSLIHCYYASWRP